MKRLKQTRVLSVKSLVRGSGYSFASTGTMTPDSDIVIQALNNALACELDSLMHYKENYFSALEMKLKADAEDYLDLAETKEEHVDLLAQRIVELGGKPNFQPIKESPTLKTHRLHLSLSKLNEQDFLEEEKRIDQVQDTIRRLENRDPETQKILEQILRHSQEQISELSRKLKKAA